MTFSIFEIATFLIAYLICSISPAIIICNLINKEDIRALGSGNAGTTNAIRVLGKFWGFIVFLMDILKVIASYYLITLLYNLFNVNLEINVILSYFMAGAVIGHCYPMYYGLKGGKGVVTLLVSIALINKQIFFVCLISGMLIILFTRTISIASISGCILLLVMTFVMNPEYIIVTCIVSAIVLFKHRANIDRIIKGEEKKIF